jgi:hypothetical protein
MTYAIIRGNNGRRHEVDFGDSPVRVEVYASEETVEIFVEADSETLPEERRRFALINVPRDQIKNQIFKFREICPARQLYFEVPFFF